MKHSFIYVIRFTLMVIGLLIFEACTHVMKVAELPILKTDTPLKGIRPKTFAFKVFKGTDNIPKWRDHSFKFDQPINAVVAKAIKNEL